MRKNIKQSVRLVMAMFMAVMMLSVNIMASPLADYQVEKTVSQIQATVRIADEGDLPVYPVVETVVLDKTGFQTLFDVAPGATHMYQDVPTVLDALCQYFLDQGIPPQDGMEMGWDTVNIPNGVYISTFLGQSTQEVDSYYSPIVGQSYWKGYSWGLYVNGQKALFYASNLMLQDGDVIDFIYEYTEEYW